MSDLEDQVISLVNVLNEKHEEEKAPIKELKDLMKKYLHIVFGQRSWCKKYGSPKLSEQLTDVF